MVHMVSSKITKCHVFGKIAYNLQVKVSIMVVKIDDLFSLEI